MKIIQWNLRGYRAQYPSLLQLIQSHHPSVVCLQETMLGNFTPSGPSGYSLESFSPSHSGVPGDGLAFLFRRDVPYCLVTLSTSLQAFAFRTGTQPQVTICNIYISPNESFSAAQLTDLTRQLPTPFILLGDLNSKSPTWGCGDLDRRGEQVEDFLTSSDVCIMNTGIPTRMDINSGNRSAIDLTMCSPQLLPCYDWSVEDDLFGSDHFPISISHAQNLAPSRDPTFIEKRADWGKFKSLTRMNESDITVEGKSIDECESIFSNKVINAAYSAIPVSSGRILPKCVPWWTPECEEATVERKRALWRFQRTRLTADKISMKRTRARAHYILKKAKQQSWETYVSTLNVHTPMAKIWSRVKKMSGKHSPNTPPCLLVNGQYISDSEEVANALASHYASVSNGSTYSESFKARKDAIESTHLNFDTTEENDYNSPITLMELVTTLKHCNKSSPGEDRITYCMLRNIHHSLLNYLLDIFNKIWESGTYPSAWRRAILLAFYKPGKPKTNAASYRPISLTSCVGKLMEKIVNHRLMIYLERNEVLSPRQFGFRQHRSTIDPITLLTSEIQSSFQRKEQAVCVFFDLEKAYDTTWKRGILQALYDSGIRGKMGSFIGAFLRDRSFRVKIGNCFSDVHEQVEGVPQGSVLSCALFALAINGLPASIPNQVKSSLYVDDFALYSSSNYAPSLERRLQLAIDEASKWAEDHGFKFSATKTIAVQFHNQRGLPSEPSLRLYDAPIAFKSTAKFLGITFDQRLKWEHHIKNLKEDCKRRLNLLRCVSHLSFGADRAVALRLYCAIIRSKLDYGCTAYTSAKERTLQKLEPVQNDALRLATGAFKSSPVMSLRADSGIPPLAIRREQLMLQYYTRALKCPGSLIYDCVTTPNDRVPNLFSTRTHQLIGYRNITLENVMPVSPSFVSPWLLEDPVCSGYQCPPKDRCPVALLKQTFQEHCYLQHRGQDHLFTDGSKDSHLACAAVFGHRVRTKKINSNGSIFTAELLAILEALYLIRESNCPDAVIFSDSKSALQAISNYKNPHPVITKIFEWLSELHARQKRVTLCWVPSHINVDGNEAADRAARLTAESNMPVDCIQLPHTDYYSQIRQKCRDSWRDIWTETPTTNKLRAIKATTNVWNSSSQDNRKHEVALARLRIGHTRLTHGYLMEGRRDEPPFCEDCVVPLSVQHLLAECPSLNNERRRFFPSCVASLTVEEKIRIILAEDNSRNFNIRKLVEFLKEIHVYDKI